MRLRLIGLEPKPPKPSPFFERRHIHLSIHVDLLHFNLAAPAAELLQTATNLASPSASPWGSSAKFSSTPMPTAPIVTGSSTVSSCSCDRHDTGLHLACASLVVMLSLLLCHW